MSLELNQENIRQIHYQTRFVDGRKYFGSFDGFVETSSKVTQHTFNPGKPEISIVLVTMDRPQKFRRTIDSLVNAASKVDHAVRLIVMDSSIKPEEVPKQTAYIPPSIESIIYYHDARMTQSIARNKAVLEVSGDSNNIAIWDGDIYSSENTLLVLSDTLDKNKDICAVAPVMIGTYNDNYQLDIALYSDINTNAIKRRKTHMPGEIGEDIWIKEGDFMRSTMMRGAFMLRKQAIEEIALLNPDHSPWLKDFVVWQNVPFFLSFRELGLDMGYLLDSKAIVAHDDRIDSLSVGTSLPWRSNETLKSLTILMSRNALYNPDNRKRNFDRFLSYNIPVIERVLGTDYEKAMEVQDIIINIAKIFSESKNANEFINDAKYTLAKVDTKLQEKLNWVINELSNENTYHRVKKILSFDISRRIYSVNGVN